MKKYLLECCVDSVESAIEAKKGGANRIELCSNLIIGGSSPSISLFNNIKKHVDIKINVLIRPRFGDFLYTDYEFEIIKEEVKMFKEAGADGVVIGVLSEDGSLDMEKMKILVKEANGMDITLHRAFDMVKDPFKTLEQVKELGINTILTSGQENNALDGITLIKELIEKSKDKVEILVGSGVNAKVVEVFLKETKAHAFHLSGKENINSKMIYRKENVSMGLPMMSEYEIFRTNSNKIKEVNNLLK